jgi:hypothetical protein
VAALVRVAAAAKAWAPREQLAAAAQERAHPWAEPAALVEQAERAALVEPVALLVEPAEPAAISR